jgi:hypothetical protein
MLWDLMTMFYDIAAPAPDNKINIQQNFDTTTTTGTASYRFDDLPTRVVTKIMPANYDISKVAGVVRIAGGPSDTTGDTIVINAQKETGLNATLSETNLELATYTYNNSALTGLDTRLTHEDIHGALERANKETNIGVLEKLRTGSITNATVSLTVDTQVSAFNMSTSLTSLSTSVTALTGLTQADELAYKASLQGFVKRGQILIGDSTDQSNATFSLDALDSLLNHLVLRQLTSSSNSTIKAAALAIETQLKGLRNYLTLTSISADLRTDGYAWTADPGLRVYEQVTPNVSARITTYNYNQKIWTSSEYTDGKNWFDRAAGTKYAVRLDPYNDVDDVNRTFTDNDTAGTTRRLLTITYKIYRNGNMSDNSVGNVINGTINGATWGYDPIKMERAYAAAMDNFQTSYYTYSFYGVGHNGEQILEAVALRRLNDRDATIAPMVAVDARSALGPVASLEQDRVYLTAANWVSYLDALQTLGKLTLTQRNSFAALTFSDTSVTSLITTAFGQTLRTDIKLPIADGLMMTKSGDSFTYSVDIDQIQDDGGLYLPKSVKISKVETLNVTVPAAYVTGRDAASVYNVKYDTVMGLNQYGLWFAGVENVTLNLNATTTDGRADTVTVNPTRSVDNLTINTGDGNDTATVNTNVVKSLTLNAGNGTNSVTITATAAKTVTITTGTGNDTITATSTGSDDVTINTGDGNDAVTVNTNAANSLTVNAGNGNNTVMATATAATTVSVTSGTGDDTIGVTSTGSDNLTINAGNGTNSVNVTANTAKVVDVVTGDGNDTVVFNATDATTETISTNAGVDYIFVISAKGTTTVDAGSGADFIYVNYENATTSTNDNRIGGTLNLKGGLGSDSYVIGLTGHGNARINIQEVQPTGPTDPAASDSDALTVEGSNAADLFLFRRKSISAVEIDSHGNFVPNAGAVRVGYTQDLESILVKGNEGNDIFVLDDTSVPLDIRGGRGNDQFQVGQVFKSQRDATSNVAEEDQFETIPTTQGFLSNGVSAPASLWGGDGDDTFTVYRNVAELSLYGEADNDNFLIRAFVRVNPDDPDAPFTNINGGQGADFISYTVNAPVNIEGGDGLDTLTVIGTEFGEDFVVSEDGIYGGGLAISYNGIEKLVLDALAGNDTFFIAGTKDNVVVSLVGGQGSDTFNIGGGNVDGAGKEIPIAVVSNDLRGHSGIIDHVVTATGDGTNAPVYVNVATQQISASVMDDEEAGVMILAGNQNLRVFEDVSASLAALTLASYALVLTKAPAEPVRISAVPTRKDGTALNGIALNGQPNGAVFIFDQTNWFKPQTVTVTAYNDSVVEGTEFLEIKHAAIEGNFAGDGSPYDNLAIRRMVVEVIDNDKAGVLIAKSGDSNQVIEGGADDTYNVVLTKAPTANVTVTVTGDSQTSIVGAATDGTYTLTFTSTNWNIPQVVTMHAIDDTVKEGKHYSRITNVVSATGGYAGVLADSVDVTVIDNDVAGILITQSKGSTDVTEITTTVPIGGGQVLELPSGTAIKGTFGTGAAGSLPEAKDNDYIGNAQDIDLGKWSSFSNPDIYEPTTIPHITVNATGEGRSDFFKFTIASVPTDGSGVKVNIDIDQTNQNAYWLGALTLERVGSSDFAYALPRYDVYGWNHQTYRAGTLELQTTPAVLDADNDASMAMLIKSAGTYVIRVSDRYWGGVPNGAAYNLNVSVEGHVGANFVFTPDPVQEIEGAAQNIDGNSGWYTLHNPEIGDGVSFDSDVSYSTIQGYGDDTVDSYTFAITAANLKRDAAQFSSTTLNSGTYYLGATITMAGPVTTGDQWILNVDGTTYTYTVTGSDTTLANVANGIKGQLPAKYNATVATDSGTGVTTLSLSDTTGFTLTTPYINHINPASVMATAGSATALFQSMQMTFSGAITGSSTWRVIVDGINFDVTPATSTTSTVAALRTLIDAHADYVAGGTGLTIIITRANSASFKAQFQQTGLSPVGRVSISGLPDASTRATTKWTSATLNITPAHDNETVTVTINGTAYNAVGSTSVATLISRIAAAVTATGRTITTTASSVTIADPNGFTIDYSVAAATAQGTIALTSDTWKSASVQLAVVSGHSFNTDDTFHVTVNGSTYTSTLNSLTAVGNDLRDKINAVSGYLATYDSGTGLLVVRQIAAVSTPTISASVIAAVGGSASTSSGSSGIHELTIGGSIVAGEVWRVTITGSAKRECKLHSAVRQHCRERSDRNRGIDQCG